jgi:hypothetical protein
MKYKELDPKDGMYLWGEVCETDPRITKHVSQRGGFTAIAAQSQIKAATKLWGPYGGKWGVNNLSYEFVWSKDGNPVGLMLHAEFYYPMIEFEECDNPEYMRTGKGPEKLRTAFERPTSFPISGDMPYKPGDECTKKLLTDVTTKALSKLGFNADVFEGRFDDNRYVSEMKKKFIATENVKPSETNVKPDDVNVKPSETKEDPAWEPDAGVEDKRFKAAVQSIIKHPNWDQKIFVKTLEDLGWFEMADIDSEAEKRKFVKTLRDRMGIEHPSAK